MWRVIREYPIIVMLVFSVFYLYAADLPQTHRAREIRNVERPFYYPIISCIRDAFYPLIDKPKRETIKQKREQLSTPANNP